MKNLLLLPLMVIVLTGFFASSTEAQEESGTIQGVLLDQSTQRPVRGASVRLIGSPVEARTDMKGAFTLTAPAGKYAGVVANRTDGGILLIEAEVEVSSGAVEDLGEIEVAPSSGSVSPASPPAQPGPPIDAIPAPEIQPAPPADLPDGWRLHPWLGAHLAETTADYGPQGGSGAAVVVTRIYRASPADNAGFEPGDLIEEIEGEAVSGVHDALRRLDSLPLGREIEVVVNRNGESIPLKTTLLPVPRAAIMALWDLGEELEGMSAPPQEGPGVDPPQGGPSHPLLEEARRQAARGNFPAADRAYEEYLGGNPQDGPVWAEYAEMVYHNIQNAKGMALMAQAVKKPGLHPMEKTRLRLIIAQRRLESGNLSTARQMLLEAKREDPFNPVIDDLLHTIDLIVLQASGQIPGPGQPVPYGARAGVPADAQQVLVNELIGKIVKELEKD